VSIVKRNVPCSTNKQQANKGHQKLEEGRREKKGRKEVGRDERRDDDGR
jgi:hypothetical protein